MSLTARETVYYCRDILTKINVLSLCWFFYLKYTQIVLILIHVTFFAIIRHNYSMVKAKAIDLT